MPITVTEDEEEVGGHALVDLGALASSPQPHLSIRRQDAEPRHLGPDGWQPEVFWLTPYAAETIGGRTIVRLGPAVVDRIEELVPVEIVEESGQSFGIVSWPYVTPAPIGSGVTIRPSGTEQASAPVVTPPEPVASPPVDIVVPPEPEPVRLPPIPTEDGRKAIEAPSIQPTPPRMRGWAIAAALLALLLGAAAAAGWVYRDQLPWLATAQSEASPQPQPQPQPQPLPTDIAELERRYATLLQSRAPQPDLTAFGREAIEAGQGALAFRAFEEADPAASEEAAWQLARYYDPRVTAGAARSAAIPNAVWSAYYYALWKSRSTRHADELRGLCDLSLDGAARERIQPFCRA